MPRFLEEVNKYSATIYWRVGDKMAAIVLNTNNYTFIIEFYKEGAALPDNNSLMVSGRRHINIYTYFDTYPGMIDLLRNEKPIIAIYWEDLKYGWISTQIEPVGEAERPSP